MHTIATLYALREYLGIAADDAAEDERLVAALTATTATIERRTQRHFLPYVATLTHAITDPRVLLLRDDLLTLQSIVTADGTSLDLNEIEQRGGVLFLSEEAAFAIPAASDATVEITGVWGYHPQPSEAWRESDATSTADINDTIGRIIVDTLTDSAGQPIFQRGQVLRLADEYMRVTAIDEGNNLVSVERAVNGTTADTYLTDLPVFIFQPAPDAHALCLRWATWLYREVDYLPDTVPTALTDALVSLRRVTV